MEPSSTSSYRCSSCPGEKKLTDFYLFKDGKYAGKRRTGQCKPCSVKRQSDYAAKNVERVQKRSKTYHLANRDRLLPAARARNRKIKARVMAAYSSEVPACACCREIEPLFLAIDHIDGGGAKQRKALGLQTGDQFYRWLIKQNFPPGYRVLCHNCNLGRSLNGGKCPHEVSL